MLPWDLASPRDSSGSGWSVNRGSCIFNVPISPWHDLHLLIVFFASILCFQQRLEGNDPPLPSSLPPPPPLPPGGCGGGVGRRVGEEGGFGGEGGGRGRRLRYNLIRPAATRRFLALVYSGDTRLVGVSFTTYHFFSKKARVSSLPTTIQRSLAITRRVPELSLYTAQRRSRPPLSVRCPLHRCQAKIWRAFPPLQRRFQKGLCLICITRRLPSAFPASTAETRTHSPFWSVCPSRRTIYKKGESFELSNDDSKVSRHERDAFLRLPSTAERRSRPPLSVRCPLHRCQARIWRAFPSPQPRFQRCLSSIRKSRRLSSPFLPSTADTHTSAPLVGALSTPFSQTFFASVCTSPTTTLEVCPSPVNHGLDVCCFHKNLNHGHHVLCLHKILNHGHVFAVSIKF